MSRIYALSNQKGGVGKTTTAINLAAYLSESGKKVLLIDIDPQGNASSGLGIDSKKSQNTVYQVLIGEISARDAIQKTQFENLHLLPSNIDLSAAEHDLLLIEDQKENKLKRAIKSIENDYDIIIIDCPPSLGILTINALCASDSVIIVLQCEYYALEGLTQLMRIISEVQKNLNKNLSLEGVLLTMYNSQTNLSKQVKEDVESFFKDKVFKSVIPRNVKLSEAPSYAMPIGIYDAKSKGAKAYKEFSDEILTRIQ